MIHCVFCGESLSFIPGQKDTEILWCNNCGAIDRVIDGKHHVTIPKLSLRELEKCHSTHE